MNDGIWPKDDADAIRRALATEGGHLFVGEHGYTLRYANGGTSSGYQIAPMKSACLARGLPVIDTRALDFEVAFVLACRSPMIAVGEPPGPGPFCADPESLGPLSYAPLRHVAGLYRAAGAEVSNLPEEDMTRPTAGTADAALAAAKEDTAECAQSTPGGPIVRPRRTERT